jgi:hypothetical protein
MTEPSTAPAPPAPPTRKKLLIGSAAALAVAAAGLVVFVLPAEFGIDPTGAGAALGLTKLSEPENIYLERGMKRTNVLYPIEAGEGDRLSLRETIASKGVTLPAGADIKSDRFQVELQAYEGIELKYVLAEGAPMLFSWRATAPVNVDMHSHPFEGGDALTESFVIDNLQTQNAVYVAPFTGIHGWFWQNRTLKPVTLTLTAHGMFTGSKLFDEAGEHDRALSPPDAAAEPRTGE